MSKETLEIIQGLSQAAANAYDGGHMENYALDGQARKVGLNREQGCPIKDKRVNDGFSVKFYGDSMIISYQSDVMMKNLKDNGFENDIARMLNEVKKSLPVDIAVCAAAVSDFKPISKSKNKIKKGISNLDYMRLEKNPDILDYLSKNNKARPKMVVGFSAETENVIQNSKKKN